MEKLLIKKSPAATDHVVFLNIAHRKLRKDYHISVDYSN